MTLKKTVLIEGIFLLVISFVGVGESIRLISDIDPHTVYDALGPGYYILFLSLALTATGALHLIVNYGKGVATEKVVVDKAMRMKTIYMVLTMALYILLIDIVGYFFSTPLFFLMEFRLAGVTSWRRNIILTVIVSAVYYFVFVEYCDMVFPRGIFY
jgi:putative tricarboxylic transport membrane protein